MHLSSSPYIQPAEGNNDHIKWKQEQDCAYAQKQNNIKINFQREKLILSEEADSKVKN